MQNKRKEILKVIYNLQNKYHTVSFLISAIENQINYNKEDIKEVLNEEVQSGRLIKKYEIVCPIHNHTLGYANFKNEIKNKYMCEECEIEIPIGKLNILKHYYFNERKEYA